MSYETTGRAANRLSKKSILPWPIADSDLEELIWDDPDLYGSDTWELNVLEAYKELNTALKILKPFDKIVCVDDIYVSLLNKNKNLIINGFQLAVEERFRLKGPSQIHNINFLCNNLTESSPFWTYKSDTYKHNGKFWHKKEFKSAKEMIDVIADDDCGQVYAKRIEVKRVWANDLDI